MKILAIDTSCDETAVAVTEGRKVLAHESYSHILLHKKWGGVVPSITKRAHEERIDTVVEEALKKSKISDLRSQISYLAVTQGPGLAIALEVGINKAKELAAKYDKKIIAVNHMEGHIYSAFTQNSAGKPDHDFSFPYLAILVSGGHTEIVIWKDNLSYEVIGKKLDDAAGEALDKAARMLGFSYPGGEVIERLAAEVDNVDIYKFPRPMRRSGDLNFSFSGLKTSFFYYTQKMSEEDKALHIKELASSFQAAVFESLLIKTELAIKQTGIKNLIVAGGVSANQRLRTFMRSLVSKYSGTVLFPTYKYLNGDNAAMIGVAAQYKADKGIFADPENLDRIPRLSL
jgi:N6-L-threonylcarbamoyladenine synthase